MKISRLINLKYSLGILLSFAGITSSSALSLSEENKDNTLLNVSGQVRFDYQHTDYDGETSDPNTGFMGRYFLVKFDGTITPGLTYSWRHRLNSPAHDNKFFDMADWIYVRYDYNKWSFSGGKEVVAIGGWEYDSNPINLFGTSVFWNNIGCFQFGVTAGYNITPADRLSFQISESPFFTTDNRNLYSYNLMWQANHGIFSPLWSVNMAEYSPGHYINYISLGNRITAGKWEVELDLLNRAAAHQTFLFKDCSVVTNIAYCPTSAWRIHGKFTYDVNHSGTDADLCVLNGTELKMAGGGVEFYPIKKDRMALRAHATAYYSWGHNVNENNLMQNKTLLIAVGLTWRMDFFTLKRSLNP